MFLKADSVIWSLLALVVLVLIVLGFILWVASRPEKENRGQAKRLVRMRNDTLRASFRQAVELIEANIAGRSQRLTLPWVLVLNEGSEPDPLPLGHSGIAQALSADSTASASAQGISWNFFDKGIVINMLGAYLGTPDSDDDTERPWEEFLSLCRDYRPERPFDSLVVTVPVDLLISSDPNARLELSRLAKLANRRLWKAQNRFAMRFSVYVMVSGCERLPGFAPFARALPEAMRKSMLGWSSPFEITATYQENWVDQAVDHTVQTLSDTSAELYVLNLEGDSSPYFLLPGQIDSLRPQLQLYVNELMRPSTYHEPFLMRGIYFTGDAGEAAEQALRVMNGEDAPAQLENSGHAATQAAAKTTDPAVTEPTNETPADSQALLPAAQDLAHVRPGADRDGYRLDPTPVFLRDLFEQKIFAEYGLARPSGSQLTSRPLLGRGARWAAWTLIGGWSLGLLIGSVILHKQSNALHEVLLKFKNDNEQHALALRNGETISAEAKNRRAVALLGVMEQMDGKRLWSIFMPGSWPMVDKLPGDLREYLERAFGDIAAATLHRALQAKVSQLTGVPQDDSTGELIQGASCTALSNAVDENVRYTQLGFQELPEFAALLSYVTSVEQTSMAFAAMQRLQAPGIAPDPRDLQLLVKLVFGADLNFVSQRSSELFRSKAASAHKVNLAPAQEAMRCALRQRTLRLQDAAFNNNPLLNSQRELNASVNSLTETVEDNSDAKLQLESLTALLAEIKAHEALLAAGASNAAWMRRPTFAPGAAWDSLLTRITATPLLGSELALQTREKFEGSYKGFVIELNEELSDYANTEVVWNDDEMRYTLGSALSGLRAGLSALLAEPYMATANNLPAPELNSNPGANHPLNWELPRLDEALATQEQRKKFKSDILPRFPLSSQRAIEHIVRARLSNQVMTHVNAALAPSPKLPSTTLDLAAMEAERTRLTRVQLLLADLGARRDGDALRSLITRDALRKLQTLDEALNRSELYAIKGRSFAFWQGERSPVLGAFGLPDASGLQPYLAQQVARAEQLSKEADAVLNLLPASAASNTQAQRWQSLSRDLERFKLKNPNSSLLALENFLTAMAGDVDGQNCQERLQGKVLSGRPSDFFAERHAQLSASLMQRCGELRLKEQQALWSVFSNDFNQTLAGRPPFAAPGWSAEAPVIEVDEIAPLLRGYERARPAMQALLQQQKGSAAGVAVQRFVDQFDRSRNFLAPLVPAEENTPAGYDVAVEFRANQGAEIQGNKVIDWSLEIGRQRLSLRDAPKPMRWEPGQPITLTLRLAKDGQFSPLADPKQPALSVDGKTVTLRFADAWSLFNLIGRQREAEARNDGRSQLLRVEFPLQMDSPTVPANAPTTKGAAQPLPAALKPAEVGENRAKVYLRLTLSPPGKRTPLIWPGPLPTRAPEPLKP
jgi:type VI secretion system protein ImpL